MTKFELTPEEEAKLKVWQDKIKDLYGEYGTYQYIFEPNGIGLSITVKSNLTNLTIDLTDVDKW